MVGERIKRYLTENGIKQSFLCEKIGIAPSQLSDICNKGRSIDCVLYYKICKALNQPLEAFLEDEEEA
jgi:transcriptional regulator with XRE-family HTH domain